MPRQLDILALEPFYGGARRLMLETIVRTSRHRWTVLKLPPRRIERRLTAAAHWFAELLTRHWSGRVDAIFTSEAMNLSDLTRLVPQLAKKPAVVYFHANQLPPAHARHETPLDLVNLNTAAAATEVWFNSVYHFKSFVTTAGALVNRTPELTMRSPIPDLMKKARVMLPPVDLAFLTEALQGTEIGRRRRTIFLDTRDANFALINTAFRTLDRRGEGYSLITVGPLDNLAPELPRRTLPERDEVAQVHALQEASVIVSAKADATADHHVVRALALGCWPVVPNAGVYPELIPDSIHPNCLYPPNPDGLVSRLLDTWHLGRPTDFEGDVLKVLSQFDSINACKAIDERLEELAAANPTPDAPPPSKRRSRPQGE
jgi:hypothetical protein